MSVPQPETNGPDAEALARRLARERAARKAAEQLLEQKSLALFEAMRSATQAQRRLELALWASGEAIWEWEADTDLIRTTRYAALGGAPVHEEALLLDVLDRIHAEDIERAVLAWRLHVAGSTAELDVEYRDAKGAGWFRSRGRVVERDAEGRALRMLGTVKDISLQRRQDESLRLLGHAFANSRDALVLCDGQWRVLEANQAFLALCALAPSSLAGLDAAALMPALPEAAARSGDGASHLWAPDARLRLSGSALPVELSATRLPPTAAGEAQWIVSLRDLREAKRLEGELDSLARLDRTTGLPNRGALQLAVQAALDEAGSRPLPVLWLDLDGFRTVNEALGPREADGLLAQCAERLVPVLPEGWTVGRWGGDEFLVLGRPGDDVQRALAVGKGLLAAIAAPLVAGGETFRITASAGIGVAPEHGESGEALVRNAGTALRAAKGNGRARLETYHPSLDDDGLQRLRLVNLLRDACEADAFRFVGQPRLDAARRVVGHEVLVRWHPPELGPVSPAQFIPLAEDAGLIGRIGRLAIRAAVALAADLKRAGRREKVSVNLSPHQLKDPMLAEVLSAELAAGGATPGDLEIEVTESALVQDLAGARRVLSGLREDGFTLALDDFGTGYSSLSYLQTLPFHKIKLDRIFVRDVATDARAARLVAGVVDLCAALELAVVAEGVETAAQFERLVALGVPEFQGFLFHRPLPFEAIRALPRN